MRAVAGASVCDGDACKQRRGGLFTGRFECWCGQEMVKMIMPKDYTRATWAEASDKKTRADLVSNAGWRCCMHVYVESR